MKKISEGKKYWFSIIKLLKEEGHQSSFVLEGPDGKKYLLKEAPYRHYNLEPGRKIRCRIDRINCRGEVFIEPDNPVYSEGKTYKFKIAGEGISSNLDGSEVPVIIVKDYFGHEHTITRPPKGNPGSEAELQVTRIIKGKLHLENGIKPVSRKYLRKGVWHTFMVERVFKAMDNESYYLLHHAEGSNFSLPLRYYEYYGFRPGMEIKGKIVKIRENGEAVVEPLNPYYKNNQVLKLKIVSHAFNPVNQSFTLQLKDKFGFGHRIETTALPADDVVRCKVSFIRKGKPALVLL